jgi:hypothetical protein
MKTTKLIPRLPNPSGKGGFLDNPDNKAHGRWSKDTSISYWLNKLMRMDIKEFRSFKPETKAQEIAKKALAKAPDRLDYFREIMDRTEGKAPLTIDHTNNGSYFGLTSEEREARINELSAKLANELKI